MVNTKNGNHFLVLCTILGTIRAQDWKNPNFHGGTHGTIQADKTMYNYGTTTISDIVAHLYNLCPDPPVGQFSECDQTPFSMSTLLATGSTMEDGTITCYPSGTYRYGDRNPLLDGLAAAVPNMARTENVRTVICNPVPGHPDCQTYEHAQHHFTSGIRINYMGEYHSDVIFSCTVTVDPSPFNFCSFFTGIGSIVAGDLRPFFALAGLFCGL